MLVKSRVTFLACLYISGVSADNGVPRFQYKSILIAGFDIGVFCGGHNFPNMGPIPHFMGTYAFVWTSRIWIRPLPDFGGHLAGAGAPERPFLPELHEQMWHEPRYQHSCRILSKYRIMGYQSNRPIKGIPKLDHFQTLPIHKCTMCDFPNFSARSNNS